MTTQQNHQAHDPEVTLDEDQAQAALDLLSDVGYDEEDHPELSGIQDTLEQIVNGEDDVSLLPDHAKVLADYLRERVGDDDHKDVLLSLYSVAAQHGLSDLTELGSDHDGGVGDVDRDNTGPAPAENDRDGNSVPDDEERNGDETGEDRT